MSPVDAEQLAAYLSAPRTIREVSVRFKVSKVTAAIWIRMFPTRVDQRKEGFRGPWSKTYQIQRTTTKGSTP